MAKHMHEKNAEKERKFLQDETNSEQQQWKASNDKLERRAKYLPHFTLPGSMSKRSLHGQKIQGLEARRNLNNTQLDQHIESIKASRRGSSTMKIPKSTRYTKRVNLPVNHYVNHDNNKNKNLHNGSDQFLTKIHQTEQKKKFPCNETNLKQRQLKVRNDSRNKSDDELKRWSKCILHLSTPGMSQRNLMMNEGSVEQQEDDGKSKESNHDDDSVSVAEFHNNNNNNNNTTSPPPQSEMDKQYQEDRDLSIVLINSTRVEAGLSPLQQSGYLDDLAHVQAECMAATRRVELACTCIKTLKELLVSDHVACNVQIGDSVLEMHMNMMSEHPHNRDNILSTRFDEYGVGYAKDEDGNLYCCQYFRRSTKNC